MHNISGFIIGGVLLITEDIKFDKMFGWNKNSHLNKTVLAILSDAIIIAQQSPNVTPSILTN